MTITSKTDKESLVRELLAAQQKGQSLKTTLLFAGHSTDANDVDESNAKLSAQIDRLLALMMRDWVGGAAEIRAQFEAANAELQTSVEKIEQNIETAQNVIAFVGKVEEIVGTAAKLAAAVA